jgi:hypothetical protein
MSTNGMTSWAVDLANVGAIYPFQGTEVLLVFLGVVFWLAFHIVQIRQEKEELEGKSRSADEVEDARDLIGQY